MLNFFDYLVNVVQQLFDTIVTFWTLTVAQYGFIVSLVTIFVGLIDSLPLIVALSFDIVLAFGVIKFILGRMNS